MASKEKELTDTELVNYINSVVDKFADCNDTLSVAPPLSARADNAMRRRKAIIRVYKNAQAEMVARNLITIH